MLALSQMGCLGSQAALHVYALDILASGSSGDSTLPWSVPAKEPLDCHQVGAVWHCNVDANELAERRAALAAIDEYEARLSTWKKAAEEREKRGIRAALNAGAGVSGGVVRAHSAPMANAEVEAVLTAAGVPQQWHQDFVAIAYCESRWRRDAVGDAGQSLGMWQLWRGWFAKAGEDINSWSDPVTNARTALYVRQVRGRFGGGGGWTCADLLGIP